MICEAETRQVEEYQKERQRIGKFIVSCKYRATLNNPDDEHSRLIGQIEQLKGSLEHAQMDRRRKMEYDLVAEKINTLPSRFELEKWALIRLLLSTLIQIHIRIIHSLENDIVAVRTEHETLNRSIHMQKVSFDSIVGSLGALRLSGKDTVDSTPRLTPAPETLLLEAEPEPEPEPEPEHDIEMGEVEEDPKSKKKAREEMEEGEATDASSELSEVPDDE